MKKIINNRPIFYCFISLWLGIFLSKPIFSFEIPTIVFACVTLATIAFLCIRFKCLQRLLLILGCFGIGVLIFFISITAYTPKDLGTTDHLVLGRISICTNYDSSQNIVLDNVEIEGQQIGNVSVFVYGTTELEEGCVIKFTSKLVACNAFTLGKYNGYIYKNNIKYSATIRFEQVEVVKMGQLSFVEKLRLNIKFKLFENMGKTEAGISYASLFGDKTFLQDGIRADFSVSGMAHMLAVSGLHIGFVVAMISKFLRKLKINKKVGFCVLVGLLFFYCTLCSFTASVVRATIMFSILEFAKLLKSKYDRLNAWSLAGIICILICPFNAFDSGFLLSFACVLCIFIFFAPVTEMLKRWHFPNWLANSLGIIIPVQLGVMPLIAQFFGKTSLFSILANLIAIPIFELFFSLLFVFAFLVAVIPPLAFILALPNFIVGIIIKIAEFIASLDFAIIKLTALTSIMVLSFYAGLFVLSHFVNLKQKRKWLVSLAIFVFASVMGILSTFALVPQNSKVSVLNSYGTSVCVFELNGTSVAVGNFDKNSLALVENYAEASRLYKIDYIISLNNYIPLNQNNIFKNVILCQNILEEKTENISLNNVDLEIVEYNQKLAGIILKSNVNVFICADEKLTAGQYIEFGKTYNYFDLIIGNQDYISRYLDNIEYGNLLLNGNKMINSLNEGTKECLGNWTFSLINNKICNVRGVD